jgi:hypothetical protein
MGSDAEGMEEIHVPTAGSSSARRHRSTRGKSDAGGSAAAITVVASAHGIKIAGDAEGSDFCWAPVVPAPNRALRYGTTVPDKTCFT